MIQNHTLTTVLALGALVGAAGCGDASASDSVGGKCAQMCQHGDSCPYLYAERDCVSECETAVEEAALLGGTCPGAIDEVIACHTQLTCDELTRRATGGFYNDECVMREQAAAQCIPGDAVEPDPNADELTLACEAVCNAIDDCPRTLAEPDCLEVCVSGYRRADNGMASCTAAIVDTLNCQAAMSCSEIENRVRGGAPNDSCLEADRTAEASCR
jgi:hypothetical protein